MANGNAKTAKKGQNNSTADKKKVGFPLTAFQWLIKLISVWDRAGVSTHSGRANYAILIPSQVTAWSHNIA